MKRAQADSRNHQLFQKYAHEIRRGTLPPGTRMPSLRTEAKRQGVAAATVQQAYNLLEADGLIVKRQGEGSFVSEQLPKLSLADTVAVCMQSQGHVFGDHHTLLVRKLQAQGRVCLTFELPHTDADFAFLGRTLNSGVRTLLCQGSQGWRDDVLRSAMRQGVMVIGIIEWPRRALGGKASRVVVDHVGGGRIVADHLWAKGHRHILVVGPENMLAEMTAPDATEKHSHAFAAAWRARGGTWASLSPIADTEVSIDLHGTPLRIPPFDATRLVSLLRGHPTPTAVFGLMDNVAWEVQKLVLEQAPDLHGRIEIIGYGDTPWSQFGQPPFSSVSLNIEGMADAVGKIVELSQIGRTAQPFEVLVPPRLVVRSSAAESR